MVKKISELTSKEKMLRVSVDSIPIVGGFF
jgi:hypothetical protein